MEDRIKEINDEIEKLEGTARTFRRLGWFESEKALLLKIEEKKDDLSLLKIDGDQSSQK